MMTAFNPKFMSAGERLLWEYGVTKPSHIDLEAIAIDHGAQVRYRPMGGCEARLLACGENAVISINSSSNPGRKRFSLGHELGHWIQDRKTGMFLCAKEDISPINSAARSAESYANAFASQLILPDYLVRPWIDGKKGTLEVASSLAREFQSSLTAAAIKIASLTSAPVCLACHTRKRRAWFRKSNFFPAELYLQDELHYETDAFEMAFAPTASGMSRPRREPADRWFTGPDVRRMQVDVQSIRLPDGSVLTMLSGIR